MPPDDEPKFLSAPPPGWVAPEVAKLMAEPELEAAISEAAHGLATFTTSIAREFERADWDPRARGLSIATRSHRLDAATIEVPITWGDELAVLGGGLIWKPSEITIELNARRGLPRVPTLEEWLAIRGKQLEDGCVIAAAREIAHPTGGTAFEHLEVQAMERDRPITLVRTLFEVPVLAVLSLSTFAELDDTKSVELAYAFSRLRVK